MNTESHKLLPCSPETSAGFESPFDLLQACHDKVLRMSELLERLMAYIDERGHDANSRSAAADVLRYFDLAAPQHHEDEERHVFPVLLAQGDARQRAAIARLQTEHRRFESDWRQLRTILQGWRDDLAPCAVDAGARVLVTDFVAMNRGHVELEEALTYPAARSLFGADELARMGAEMQARRQG